MLYSQALELIRAQETQNIYLLTPDDGGMALLLPRALAKVARPADIQTIDAASLRVDAARELAKDCGFSPRGGSSRTHIVIRRMDRLAAYCVGAVLKAVEESQFARFIFVGSSIPYACQTLASRSLVVRLPFLTRKAALGNIQALKMDAATVDSQDLWDGTLGGSLQNLKDHKDRVEILAALSRLNLSDLCGLVESPAFDRTLKPMMTPEEIEYVQRDASPTRRQLVALLILERLRG